jgi:peptidoglycan/LPS O-acetylase OafA/YrhL
MSATLAPAESSHPDATRRYRAHRSHADGRLTFRPDIEGMRAVAVLLVVLGHAGVGLFSGGYVGVDMFFVISGFLITSLLLKEAAQTKQISIVGFYARRMMRLLPASTLVLLATVAGAWLWLSPLQFRSTATDAISSAFYVNNFRLAINGTDYFAAAAAPSPFQHFWSLAVEEQFYVVWPVLIIAATWAATRHGKGQIRFVAAVLVPLVLVSFALSLTVTHRSAPWAYFGSHTRAWELGLGAIVALASGRLTRLRPYVAAALTWVGLGAIVVAAVLYTEATPFPGAAALLPVAGTAILLGAGCAAPRFGAGIALRRAPVQLVGSLSYGLYLWHWPMLIIAPIALGLEHGVATGLLVCGAAAVLAFVSLHFVENPVRKLEFLRAHPRRGVALGLFLSAVASAATLAVAVALPPPIPYGRPVSGVQQAVETADDPTALLRRLVAQSARLDTLPGNLSPALAEVHNDFPASYVDGCHLDVPDVELPGPCAYGDVTSSTTVVLFGDSHAAQWLPALARLANLHHWRLLSRTKSSCTPADVQITLDMLKRAYTECDTFRHKTLNEIKRIGPTLVIMASIVDKDGPTPESQTVLPMWTDGWSRTFATVRDASKAAALLVDTPRADEDIPDCVAANPTKLTACAGSAGAVLRKPERRIAIAAAASSIGVTVVDPNPWLCANVCPAVVGDLLVYRDAHHLTRAYSTMLSWPLDSILTPLIEVPLVNGK